jgi:glycosyltransferase involved in cell wall biosynthesis
MKGKSRQRRGGLAVETLDGLPAGERRERMRRAAYLVVAEAHDERVLMEAFASGLAVLACRQGAAAELVEPGRNGFLFESPHELARHMTWAEAFPEKMRQMGECAQADYHARFIAHWSYQKLFGERRRFARAL